MIRLPPVMPVPNGSIRVSQEIITIGISADEIHLFPFPPRSLQRPPEAVRDEEEDVKGVPSVLKLVVQRKELDRSIHYVWLSAHALPNGSRLSCGAELEDSQT